MGVTPPICPTCPAAARLQIWRPIRGNESGFKRPKIPPTADPGGGSGMQSDFRQNKQPPPSSENPTQECKIL